MFAQPCFIEAVAVDEAFRVPPRVAAARGRHGGLCGTELYTYASYQQRQRLEDIIGARCRLMDCESTAATVQRCTQRPGSADT